MKFFQGMTRLNEAQGMRKMRPTPLRPIAPTEHNFKIGDRVEGILHGPGVVTTPYDHNGHVVVQHDSGYEISHIARELKGI